jgi:hypothetical protein
MRTHFISQISRAIKTLNPNEVEEMASRPIRVGLIAPDSQSFAEMEDFLTPQHVSTRRRMEIAEVLYRSGEPGSPQEFDLTLFHGSMTRQPNAFAFYPSHPDLTVQEVLDFREDLSLPLARHFVPFRGPVINRTIHKISRENAMFTVVTALPNVLPSALIAPWAVAEFASDTAVLTTNQVRMAFLLAASSDLDIGYRHQKAEIASVIASAFGWRALARQLIGKMPFGGGLVAKASVAYAGTFVVGSGIERLYRIGYGYTREERKAAFEQAVERGKTVAGELIANLRRGNPQP